MNDERVSRKELDKVRQRMSPRDLAILRTVHAHQFTTTRQLARLHFAGHQSEASGIRACNRVLTQLLERRVLTRLDRVIGGHRAGSSAYVWCLDVVGDRLIRAETGQPRRRFFEPSLTFLGHKLAVTETRVVIEETARGRGLEILALDIEMQAWRPFLGASGQTIHLKPDLGLITATEEHEDHWFIEVDQGTESFRTLLAKSSLYETYRSTGREQALRGVYPRVLWIMPTAKRAEQLRDHIDSAKSLDPKLFVVITPGQLAAVLADPLPSEQTDQPASEPISAPTNTSLTGSERRSL